MIFTDRKTYKSTMSLIRGTKKPSKILEELQNWLKTTFNITTYNYIFMKEDKTVEYTYELKLLLSSWKDYNSMCKEGIVIGRVTLPGRYDNNKQDIISEKFVELAYKHKLIDSENVGKIWVCYINFSTEVLTEIVRSAHESITTDVFKKYQQYSVWCICAVSTSVVVFYHSNKDIEVNESNGISDKIKKDYFTELEKHDEMHLFTMESFNIEFDSKENLDKIYQGSFYYYFK